MGTRSLNRTHLSLALGGLLACGGPFACGGDDDAGLDTDAQTASTGSTTSAGMRTATTDSETGGSSEPATTTAATEGADESTTGAMSTDPVVGIYNVIAQRPEPAFAPLPDLLHRVELPPRVTLVAEPPAGTTRVEFVVDGGKTVLDDTAPYVLDQDEEGLPGSWSLGYGAHEYVVTAFSDDVELGSTLGTFELSDAGMDPEHPEQSTEEQQAWLGDNLDAVMEVSSFTAADGHVLPYRLYSPAFYDENVRYPVLIYLHGRGQRGSDNPSSLYGSQLFRGPNSIVSPNGQDAFPAFVIVPQCADEPAHQEWAHWIGNTEDMPFTGLGADGSYMQHEEPWPSAQAVRELVDVLVSDLSIETERIYLTGESMGGFGTWEFTTRWPDVWAAGVPMAGFSDRTKVEQILHIPFWVFHGDADTSNPVEGSRAMVQALEDAGGSALYTEYPRTGHGETFQRAWSQEPELQPWIFSQRQQP